MWVNTPTSELLAYFMWHFSVTGDEREPTAEDAGTRPHPRKAWTPLTLDILALISQATPDPAEESWDSQTLLLLTIPERAEEAAAKSSPWRCLVPLVSIHTKMQHCRWGGTDTHRSPCFILHICSRLFGGFTQMLGKKKIRDFLHAGKVWLW